jgi:hypothetical protein
MNDEELRALIRQAVQKHLSIDPSPVQHPVSIASISFGQYRLERAPDDTMCLIEPAVRCNHCGFCKCHGH